MNSLPAAAGFFSMDLYRTIQDLYEEKEKLERVISSLEELQRTAALAGAPLPPPKRRGRKSMAPDERRQVSARMKRYWEARRKDKDHLERQPE